MRNEGWKTSKAVVEDLGPVWLCGTFLRVAPLEWRKGQYAYRLVRMSGLKM